MFAGSNLEQLLILGDNTGDSHVDVDNVVMSSLDECPHACGNDVIEWAFEECEVTPGGDALCPGRCVAAGQPDECTCTPICTQEEPCPVVNGENGPFITSSGYYIYSGGSPYISVNGCGSDYDAAIEVQTVADINTPIAYNNNCISGPNGAGADPSASCYDGSSPFSSASAGGCTCFANPNEPLLIWMPWYFGAAPPLGSTSVIEIRKKSVCAGDSVGACCDTNGSDQGCIDNVTADNCVGADKVFADQGKCEDQVCECIPLCAGIECGDDGCGGSCGTCDDGIACTIDICENDFNCSFTPHHGSCANNTICDGYESCSPETGCIPGNPLFCDDGVYCNGSETCDPSSGCVPGANPCPDNTTCNEETDACDPNSIPTVSEWGLVVLTLMLLINAKMYFGRRQAIT